MTISNYILTDNPEIFTTEDIYKPISPAAFHDNVHSHMLSDDIIGVCLEKQYLTKYDYPLRECYIQRLFEQYDMIIPYASEVNDENVGILLSNNNIDLSDYVSSFSEEYYLSYLRVINSKYITSSEIFICRKDLFYQLYDFIYKCPFSDNALVRDVLFRVFIGAASPAVNVKEEQLSAKNPDAFSNFIQKSELIYKYMNIIEQDYISTRKADNFSNTFIDDIQCPDDFDGKIPVWVCWWQGADQLPEIVSACVNSIKNNIPEDKAVFRLVTLENCADYVTFTPDIVEKFNQEKISYTHLAEALRSELLYRYGGLWIDATYYVSHPIPASFFEQNFYTIAFDHMEFGYDISEAKWSTSLWYSKPKSHFMQFLTELKWIYWEKQDAVIDYFIFDYEVALAYKEFPEFRKMIDECPKSSYAVYDLQLRLNQNCTYEEREKLISESNFYKINRRYEYVKETPHGDETVFGYICHKSSCNNPDNSDLVDKSLDNDISRKENTIISDTELKRPCILNGNGKLTGDILNIIRTKNPTRILDKSFVIAGCGNVSRLSIPDMLFHPVTIDCVITDPSKTTILPVDNAIYNTIYTDNSFDENTYDIIIQ